MFLQLEQQRRQSRGGTDQDRPLPDSSATSAITPHWIGRLSIGPRLEASAIVRVGVMMKRILLVAAVVLLGGCAIAGRNAVESEAQTCKATMSDPGLNSNRSITSLYDAREITFRMLAHEQTVTEEERRTLRTMGAKTAVS